MSSDFYDASPSPNSQGSEPGIVAQELSTYMTDQDAQKFCQLFSDGLSSGIGYSRILEFMERQNLDPKMTSRLRAAVIEHGDQLGEAFARFGILDAPARKLVLVAEEQGALPETFSEQARVYGQRYKRKKQVLFGMIEPAFVFCLGVFAFRNIYSNIIVATFAADTAGVLTDVAIQSLLQTAIFFLFAGGLSYAWINLPVDSSFRQAMGRIWFRMPVVSTPLRLETMSMFARYMRQSIRSGMDIFRSIELAAEATNSPWLQGSVDKAFQVLEAGYPLEQALAAMKGMPDDFIDYAGIGEETGRLEENLLFLAERYQEQAEEAYKRFLATFIYVIRIVFIVAILILAVFGGVLDMAFEL